jgi:hypothetical protein
MVLQPLLRPPPVMLQLVFKVFLRDGQHHLLVRSSGLIRLVLKGTFFRHASSVCFFYINIIDYDNEMGHIG